MFRGGPFDLSRRVPRVTYRPPFSQNLRFTQNLRVPRIESQNCHEFSHRTAMTVSSSKLSFRCRIKMGPARSFIFFFISVTAAACLSFPTTSFASKDKDDASSCGLDDIHSLLQLLNLTRIHNLLASRDSQCLSDCTFTGITCSASDVGRIVGIQLPLMNITGTIPPQLGNLSFLQVLNLSHNSFEGSIPASLGRLHSIEHLDLAGNNLEGPIPSEFCNLPLSVSLDLSHNKLSGEIPVCLRRINGTVNLGFNKLNGSIPCVTGDWSFEGNPNLFKSCEFPTPHLLMLSTLPHKHRSIAPTIGIAGSVAIATSLGAILLFICIRTYYSKKPCKKIPCASSPQSSLGMHGLMLVSREQLMAATGNFSSQNLLGRGRHGSVYRGTLANGRVVAVKVLAMGEEYNMANRYFLRECETLGMIRHRNLVKIITVYSSDSMKALILEFMPNGSLEDLLHRPKYEDGSLIRLDLKTRARVLKEVASALSYLHHDCTPPIIHCDVNPGNILLDQDMTAHLSDFGMARIIGNSNLANTLRMQRSTGYIPPEHGSGAHPQREGDVYSFGVLILEVLTRTKPIVSVKLSEWVYEALNEGIEKVSKAVLSRDGQKELQGEDGAVVIEILKLGVWCTSKRPDLRPSMRQVESVLEIATLSLEGRNSRN